MKTAVLLLLALWARAGELGGHDLPAPVIAAAAAAEGRTTVLQEMWQRRILAPDLSSWAPADMELLEKIRRAETDALEYLKRKFGDTRPWAAARRGPTPSRPLLTKGGYEKHLFHLSQDALEYFESKGAGAKWALKMTDLEGKRLFGSDGRLTPIGIGVYARARLKLEVYWRSPNGETFGTRRPPP